MSERLHLGANGPAPCHATVRECPIGGEHFEGPDAMRNAERAYAERMSTIATNSFKKNSSPNDRLTESIDIRGRSIEVLQDYEVTLQRLDDNLNSNNDMEASELEGRNNAYDYALSAYRKNVDIFEKSIVNLSQLDNYRHDLQAMLSSNREKIFNGGLDDDEKRILEAENHVLANLSRDSLTIKAKAYYDETERRKVAEVSIGKTFFESSPEIGARYSTDDGRVFEVTFCSPRDGSSTLQEVYGNGERSSEKISMDRMRPYVNNYKRVEDDRQSPYGVEAVSGDSLNALVKSDLEVSEALKNKSHALKALGEANISGDNFFNDIKRRHAEYEYHEANSKLGHALDTHANVLRRVGEKYSNDGSAKVSKGEDGEYYVSYLVNYPQGEK